jgi:RNA polymerase sigma-70 factor (ECF subfamily)
MRPCTGIVETTVAHDAVTNDVEDVYRRDGGRLWRALYAFAGNADVADEAMAEAFAQALRRGAAIRDVSGWVWRTAFRLAAGDLKDRSHVVHGAMPDSATYDPRLDDELLVALQGLTPQQRIVIVLHYYVDCPVREIGRRTGMNPLAVRSHLSRGRQRLRRLLGDSADV